MKLLCITDLHSDRAALDRIMRAEPSADLVLLGGDITNFGTPADAEDVILRLQRQYHEVLAVAGNCDSASIDQRLEELGVSIFGRGVVRQEIGFYGVSAMPPWLQTMYHLTEQEIAAALHQGRSQLGEWRSEVLLSHAPPRATRLDRTRRGEHVGSTAVRAFIETVQPSLAVFGHIHEARGVDQLGETTMINCGPAFQGRYAVAEVNAAVEVELRDA